MTKTTINLPDAVLCEAKTVAQREGTTLKEIFLAGLRSELERRREGEKLVEYRPVTFSGNGLHEDARGLDMHRIIHMAYGADRGGEGSA